MDTGHVVATIAAVLIVAGFIYQFVYKPYKAKKNGNRATGSIRRHH